MKNFLKIKSNEFLQYMQDNIGARQSTIKTYATVLDEAVDSLYAEKNKDIFYIDLLPYRHKIKDQQKKTIAKKISVIRRFIEFLKEMGYKVKALNDEQIKIEKKLPKPINDKYIFQALDSSKDDVAMMIEMIFGLGLRISEVANIKLVDIEGNWLKIIDAKGGKSRMVAIHHKLLDEIKKFIKIFNPKVYLFEIENKKMSENQIRYRLQKSFKSIGIKATPHQLRHSFATDLLNNGARINDVSELLGHSSLGTTEIYTKVSNQLKLRDYQKAHPIFKENR